MHDTFSRVMAGKKRGKEESMLTVLYKQVSSPPPPTHTPHTRRRLSPHPL